MKKSIFIILAFTIFCLTSCNNGQEKNYFEKFEYHNSFSYNSKDNVINFDYVFFLPSKEMNSTVAKAIKDSVFKDLYFENIDFTVDNYKDVIDQYIKIYVDTTFKTDDIYCTEYDDEYHLYNYLEERWSASCKTQYHNTEQKLPKVKGPKNSQAHLSRKLQKLLLKELFPFSFFLLAP